MNCRQFEDAWNDRLDHAELPDSELDARLSAHEAECGDCRALAQGYRALLSALRAPRPRVEVSTDFAARVLAASSSPRSGIWTLVRRVGPPLATAAAVLAMSSLNLRAPAKRPHDSGIRLAAAPAAVDPDELAAALAEVGIASLALAREASAPAARLGGEAIEAAGLAEGVTPLGLPIPGVSGAGSSLWSGVGGRVSASARPLAGTARSAFGFLVGVAPDG